MKKYKFNIIILVLISFLVIYLSLKDNFNSTIDYMLNANLFWILVAFFIMVFAILCQSLSLWFLIRKVKKDYKYINALGLTTIGLFFNAVTPFSSGGQPFQIYLLNKQGIKVSDSTNILLQNFITFQIALILIGTYAIVINHIFGIYPNSSLLKHIVTLGYAINVIVLIAILFISYAKKFNTNLFNKLLDFVFKFKFIKNKEEKRKKINEALDNFYNGSVNLKNNIGNFYKSFFCNLISLILIYSIPFFLFYSMGDKTSLSFRNSIVSSGYTYLIGSFVPIPGAAGGLEYGFNEFFRVFRDAGFLSAVLLMWRFITYYFGMLVGGISLSLHKGVDKK